MTKTSGLLIPLPILLALGCVPADVTEEPDLDESVADIELRRHCRAYRSCTQHDLGRMPDFDSTPDLGGTPDLSRASDDLGSTPDLAPPPSSGTSFDESLCTVFVSAASGNDANPGRSKAVAKKSISGSLGILHAGDTVCVYPGSYGPFKNPVNGTASARIHFVSVERWQAKVSGASVPITNNGDYVDIDGFDVSTTADSVGVGIANGDSQWASHCRIFNNHVHDIKAVTPGGSGGAGIVSSGWRSTAPYQGTDVQIFNNLVHDIGNSGVNAHFVQGIYIGHPQAKIHDNIVYNVSGFGLHGWHNAADVTLSNNLTSNTEGIVLGTGDSPCSTITCTRANYFVTNNILYKDRTGIVMYAGPNHVVSNNAFFGTTSSGANSKTGDPLLVHYALDGTGDFHLDPGSPLIDAGIATYAFPLDRDGVARPQGGAVDIGPYER